MGRLPHDTHERASFHRRPGEPARIGRDLGRAERMEPPSGPPPGPPPGHARPPLARGANRPPNMGASQSRRKGTPGPEGSVGKLAMAGLNQRIMSFVMDLMGPDAMLYPAGYPMDPPRTAMDLSEPH